ncbi:MAG: HD domain-containing protein [Persicimonas sp.]
MTTPSQDDIRFRRSSAAAKIPELAGGLERIGSVRVPELRNVPVTRRVQKLIDHPAFQRLRRVRQLGPTHLVYPGAVHTRFEHSLGVYSCVCMYVAALLQNRQFADMATEEDLLTVLAAGLIHDIGHYPFAHSLEALHLKGRDTPRHEEVGGRIIRGEVDELSGRRSIASLLRDEWKVDPERVIALCTGDLGDSPAPIDGVLRSIISSTIDADKMDYLERDSHHMGVPYGRNYDRGRLLASLTLNREGDGIALISKGKVPAEMFVFARYTMFSEAYWHHTVRAASAMVENALAAYHSRGNYDRERFLRVLLRYDDDRFLEWLGEQTPKGSATRYLTEGLLGNQRRLYKRVATFSRVYSEERKRRAYERIYEMQAPDLYALIDRMRARLSSLVGRSLHPADVIIDTPPRDKDELETVQIVYPEASGKRYYPLHELSRVVAGIQDDFVMVVKKIRIFVEPRLAAELAEIQSEEVDELLLEEILA